MAYTLTGTVEWIEDMAFRATAGTGATLTLDAAPTSGGAGKGPSPLELFLLGLGGCTGMDVISILRKMRQQVTSYRIGVSAEQAGKHPKVFTRILVEHQLRGRQLSAAFVRRAVELSATQYCSAAAMLAASASIEERFRIIDEDTGQEESGEIVAIPAHSSRAR